ncbi:AMPKBI domain-containing protein [Aphelenchoides bicaudatus]|nr:AMPKBI domain-containing protein [Aphelenchoides bicaudatus]
MGNNQPNFHKRERTSDGSQRSRAHSGNNLPLPLSTTNNFSSTGSTDDVPVQMKGDEYPVVFKWTNHPARSVFLAGSWDNWKTKIPLVKSTSDFSTIINLNPGKYEYKYFVDGKWQLDGNATKSEAGSGNLNNVIHIDEADFEVFCALDKDLAASNAGAAMLKMNSTGVQQPTHDTPNDREIEKLCEFTQSLPDRREFEQASSPPSLPPHLLQVILNKDTPVSCDPNVLPEPNHVMLNHLYALSIKDGVMVLSATNRHRRKFVTTILYRNLDSS